ncbi:hypothetical protein [Rhodococcus sp. MALMAid1271]|uniref:hypothetical protein n=1 Tax=Rhodococcus sp. MALMAid1271 TaxID=3411744 RepID=UPI003BA34B3B
MLDAYLAVASFRGLLQGELQDFLGRGRERDVLRAVRLRVVERTRTDCRLDGVQVDPE